MNEHPEPRTTVVAGESRRWSSSERRRGWTVATVTALYFGIPMAIIAVTNTTASDAEVAAWYASIVAGVVGLGVVTGLAIRPASTAGDVWRLTALAAAAALIGFYIPLASSNSCAAVAHFGGCYVSGAAAILAAAAPAYLAFLAPVALGRLVSRRIGQRGTDSTTFGD